MEPKEAAHSADEPSQREAEPESHGGQIDARFAAWVAEGIARYRRLLPQAQPQPEERSD
ncbi:MAG TPA: hypothetical protein VF234_00055 [Limnochordia bacterium]